MSQPVPAAHARADHFADPGQGHEADLHSLAQRERRLDHAEALAGFGTWDWDVTGGPSFWSDRLFVIYGRSKAEGVPPFDAWQRIIHPDDREALQRVIQRALAGESRDTVEFRIYTCDTGELRYIRSQGTPRMDAQGRVVGIWGVDQDVTAVRLSHLALQRSEERLRSLTALSADWLWEQDDRYRFTRMDEDRRGGPYPAPSPHVGKTRWELPHVDMDEARWEQHRAQLDRREVYRNFEVRLQAPDGSIQHFLSSGEPYFDPAGRFPRLPGRQPGRDAGAARQCRTGNHRHAVPAGVVQHVRWHLAGQQCRCGRVCEPGLLRLVRAAPDAAESAGHA
jgi:PAS domain S-box-containing protein